MDFFLIRNIEAAEENLITDSTQVNGIIGMSREGLTTSNYIDKLFEQNLIPSRKFSLLLGDSDSLSSLTLGDSNQAYVHDDFEYAELTVSPIISDTWAFKTTSFDLGNNTITSGLAVVSTRERDIVLTTDAYEQWKNVVTKSDSTLDCDSITFCGSRDKNCAQLADTVPSLKLNVSDEYVYTMPVTTWSSSGFDGKQNGCTLRVMDSNEFSSESNPGITLGLIFLKQFTLEFDQDADKMQIAVSRYAAEGVTDGKTVVKPVKPEPKEHDGRIGNGILIVLIIALVFILIILCVWFVAKQNRTSAAERNLQALAYGDESSTESTLIYGTETPDTRSQKSRFST